MSVRATAACFRATTSTPAAGANVFRSAGDVTCTLLAEGGKLTRRLILLFDVSALCHSIQIFARAKFQFHLCKCVKEIGCARVATPTHDFAAGNFLAESSHLFKYLLSGRIQS